MRLKKIFEDRFGPYHDTPDYHAMCASEFESILQSCLKLADFRKFVKDSNYGYGEDALYAMWLTLFEYFNNPTLHPYEFVGFYEYGVHYGATLTMASICADHAGVEDAWIVGISPMDGRPDYPGRDFTQIAHDLFVKYGVAGHEHMIIPHPSQSAMAIGLMGTTHRNHADLIYIDGSHSYSDVLCDLVTASSVLSHKHSVMVVDDCCNDLNLPDGWFNGHEEVTRALQTFIRHRDDWEFVGSVCHNKIYQRIN